MKTFISLFISFLIFPMTLSAQSDFEIENFDELPIQTAEVDSVSQLFWNAQSIQDKVRKNLPGNLRSRFTRSAGGKGCDIKAVTKTEGSADTCELNDDPEKMAKFIYNLSVSCNFGAYQVSVCSREEGKLLNQLKVVNPEKLVLDGDVFDLDSTM